jgi:sigma-B regulation protein RsbU (phosphoserine phosphatase)
MVSPRSQAIFYFGVFLIFAAVGFTQLQMELMKQTPLHVFTVVMGSAGFAVGYAALAVVRKFWAMPLLGLVQFFFFAIVGSFFRHTPGYAHEAGLERQMIWLGVGSILSIALGYTLFIVFFSREGAVFFRTRNEIELAAEIHRALSPVIQKRCGRFEVYGASMPSGDIGGDLVDVLEYGQRWTAYVADVSGHGVASGVLMAMVKASVRSRLLEPSSPQDLLQEVHRALYPLKTANTFITMGVVQSLSGADIQFSLAGHPAILHYGKESGKVAEHNISNLPLGILPEQDFSGASMVMQAGDVLLILTDGIIEVFNPGGDEYGTDAVKEAFAGCAERPLAEIFETVRSKALAYGEQSDDQTMLLVRCVE